MSQLEVIQANPQRDALLLQQAGNIRHYRAIYDAHAQQARESFAGAIHARLLCGSALVFLKRECRHGEFEGLRTAHFPELPERTAQAWKASADADLRANAQLRAAAQAVLLDREDPAARTTFEELSNAHFAAKSTQMKGAAEEMHLLPGPAPRKQLADRKPRELSAEERRKAERARVLSAWTSLFESLHVVALRNSMGPLAKLPPRELRDLKAQWQEASAKITKELKAIRD